MANESDFNLYLRLGFSLVGLAHGQKRSIGPWKVFTERYPTQEEVRNWAKLNCGIGLVMGKISGYVGIDADTKEAGRKLWRILPRTSMVTITPNGVHLIYRYAREIRPAVKVAVKGVIADFRAECSYLTASPSVHPTGKQYIRHGSWNPNEVPEFDPGWIESKVEVSSKSGVWNVSKYLEKIVAVAGEGGHNTTFRAACVLRDAGLSESEALAELIKWNETNCVPKWNVKDLLHKVKCAFKATGRD